MGEGTQVTFTQSPASTSLSGLIAKVANYVLAPSDSDVSAIATDSINDSIRQLNTRNWAWMRKWSDITLAANVQEFPLPTDFKNIRRLEILDNSATAKVVGSLGYIDPQSFSEIYLDRSTVGSPERYTVNNEFASGVLTMNCSVSPDFFAAYPKIRLRYWSRSPYMINGTSTFSGPTEAESFIVWDARATVASHWSPNKVAYAASRSEKIWKQLLIEDVKRDLAGW